MNKNKRIRLWQWAVLLLVLCNTGLILTIWLMPHRESGPPHGETPRDFVIRNLKFTGEQTQQYDVLIKAHQDTMHRLRHDAMEYRRQLFSTLTNDAQSGNSADSLARLIANNQEQVEMATYRHFAQVRALCTGDQKKEFDNIIGDVIKKMNGGPHGGPPPNGRQGPPPGEQGPPPDGPQNP